jgi:hypothetical protein
MNTLQAAGKPPDRAKPVPLEFDAELMVTPEDNPPPKPAGLESLLASIREHGQLVPGWVCPSPDLPEHKRLIIEGNGRVVVCRKLKRSFWAFDLGRFVPEAERIQLTCQHNHSRRVMSFGELAERASRYIELTGCTQAEASLQLNISPATLSRAFGDSRILAELRPKADQLPQSIRSLIAAVPQALMGQAIDFASGADGTRPTRDAVALFISKLKKEGQGQGRKARAITLRVNGRMVTVKVAEGDAAASVAKDLQAIVTRLGSKELANVSPDGWPFLFP